MHVLEHQTDYSLLAEGLLELDDVALVKHAQHPNFPHGGFAHRSILLALLEFLDGHDLLGFSVAAPQHHSVGALADNSKNFVFLHGNY